MSLVQTVGKRTAFEAKPGAATVGGVTRRAAQAVVASGLRLVGAFLTRHARSQLRRVEAAGTTLHYNNVTRHVMLRMTALYLLTHNRRQLVKNLYLCITKFMLS